MNDALRLAYEAAATGQAKTLRGDLAIALRPFIRRDDEAFILQHWAQQIRALAPFHRLARDEFNAYMHEVAEFLSPVTVTIACEPEAPEHVFGFIAAGPAVDVMHMLFVRWPRQCGIATALLRARFPFLGELALNYTHPTRAAHHHAKRWKLRYAPQLWRQP